MSRRRRTIARRMLEATQTTAMLTTFNEIGILEAAHFCKNLRKVGKLKLIKKRIYTSPRRFLDGGVYKVLGRDIKIWFLDLIGLRVDKYADAYWKENKLRAKPMIIDLCFQE